MNRNELFEKLKKADEEAFMVCDNHSKIDVVIGGGSVLMINDLLPTRQTLDIDTIGNPYGGHPELKEIFEKYEINPRMNAFLFSLADNWESRLTKVNMETKILDYYTLSLEDLVISKLNSHRPRDFNDIIEKKVIDKINWELLQKIIDDGEVDNSFDKRRYEEFLQRYEKYKKMYGKKNETTTI